MIAATHSNALCNRESLSDCRRVGFSVYPVLKAVCQHQMCRACVHSEW